MFDHEDHVSNGTNENILESISTLAKQFSKLREDLTKDMGAMFLPMENKLTANSNKW